MERAAETFVAAALRKSERNHGTGAAALGTSDGWYRKAVTIFRNFGLCYNNLSTAEIGLHDATHNDTIQTGEPPFHLC